MGKAVNWGLTGQARRIVATQCNFSLRSVAGSGDGKSWFALARKKSRKKSLEDFCKLSLERLLMLFFAAAVELELGEKHRYFSGRDHDFYDEIDDICECGMSDKEIRSNGGHCDCTLAKCC